MVTSPVDCINPTFKKLFSKKLLFVVFVFTLNFPMIYNYVCVCIQYNLSLVILTCLSNIVIDQNFPRYLISQRHC